VDGDVPLSGTVDHHFELVVPGPPRGQGRARINTRGGRPVHIMDPDSRTAREDLITHWIALGSPRLPSDCWWGVSIAAEFTRPKSHWKRRGGLSAEGRRRPLPGKPDADNILKLVTDACCSVGAVPDDARMCDVHVTKRWSPTGLASTRVVVFTCAFEQEAA
jgi:Holliday junction resolvase RusA-like endonuclease